MVFNADATFNNIISL